jgi:C1A family cysteine protease
VNLISELPNPVRVQGGRQTCVPHSALVAYEHYLNITTGNTYDLSEQFLYWACVQRDGLSHSPDSGTLMAAGADSLEQDGVCQEADWPYNSTEIPGNAGQDPPPGGATMAAVPFRVNQVLRVTATSVDDYKRVLASGRCAAFAIPVYNSLVNNPTAIATGRITLPLPEEAAVGGHAMCIVGYQDDASIPALGGGRFIIRNSWGNTFGAESPFGFPPGHGTIPYAYIAGMGREFGIAFL